MRKRGLRDGDVKSTGQVRSQKLVPDAQKKTKEGKVVAGAKGRGSARRGGGKGGVDMATLRVLCMPGCR